MLDLFVLIAVCTFLGFQIEKISRRYDSVLQAVKKNYNALILYFVLLLSLILFSGLRTTYNDTEGYRGLYIVIVSKEIDFSVLLQPYGGFELCQSILKNITEDPQILIMTSSIFVNCVFLWFFAKHSTRFGLTILCYFIIGPYIFSMAGIKQILAMSLSLLAIDNMLKRKYGKFTFWLIIAMLFHPYIICLFSLPFLKEGIWNKKMFFIAMGIIIAVSNLELLLSLVGNIGLEYDVSEMTSHTVNPIRVVIELIPVIVSFFARKSMREENNPLFNLGINCLLVNSVFVFLGLFFNPVYFGRIGIYFTSLSAVILPEVVNRAFVKDKFGKFVMFAFYLLFFAYMILDMTKLGENSITEDMFNHLPLFG